MSEDFEFKAFLIFQRNKYGSNRLEEKSNILGRVGKMTLRFFCFGFFFCLFVWLYPWHMEISRPEAESELHL